MTLALLVALGGALGALARWGTAELMGQLGLPVWLAILAVNAVGSTIMGWAHVKVQVLPDPWKARLSALALTGLLGGFTTFSTFSIHAVQLAAAGAWGILAVQVGGTLALALGGVWLGLRLAQPAEVAEQARRAAK